MTYAPDSSITNCVLYLREIAHSVGSGSIDETMNSDTDAVTVMCTYANLISLACGQGSMDLSGIVDVMSGMEVLAHIFGRVAHALGQV